MIAIVLSGLPGTGKSTLAGLLAPALGAAVLDKDRLRATLFQGADLEYSREQDDFCCDLLHQALGFLVRRGRRRAVVLDGRTYSRAEQVRALEAVCARLGVTTAWIECVCPAAVARERLARSGDHPAADRDPALHARLAARAEPVPEPKLVLETDRAAPAELLRRSLVWLRERGLETS